jgi:hypothetical protein
MAAENFVVRNGLVVANSTTTHVTANSTGVSANGFSGNGSLLTTLNATQLTTGTVPSARLSGTYNITSNNATYLNGQLSSYYLDATNLTGTIASARLSGSYTILASNATLATKASTVSQGGGNGTAMTFAFSGQSGQPTYLWGTNDGSSTLVWNPANFSVNYATSAGSASSATTASSATLATKASTLSQNGGTGSAMTFNWVGQTGQPSYLWGSNDGVNHYVWVPGNFNVNSAQYSVYSQVATSATSATSASYATSAGSASSATTASSATLATKASTLSMGGGNGTAMTFNWSGQSGQPTWLWGSNDGSNHYVWNPANFSVNYATSAGSATNATNATNASYLGGYAAASYPRSVSITNGNRPVVGATMIGMSASISGGVLYITLTWEYPSGTN